MNSRPDDGGVAFPTVMASPHDFPPQVDLSGSMGLTKREYAAIKALQGILAGGRGTNSFNAADAVSQADLLLAELARRQGGGE